MTIFAINKRPVRLIVILAVLVALPAVAHAEIGKTAKEFEKTFFYSEAELRVNNKTILARGKKRFDGYYYISKAKDEIYLVELAVDKDTQRIVSQTIFFPDDPTKWDFLMIVYFINETIGTVPDINKLYGTLKDMFKNVTNKLHDLPSVETSGGTEYYMEKTVFVEKNFIDNKITLKRLTNGDWAIGVWKEK